MTDSNSRNYFYKNPRNIDRKFELGWVNPRKGKATIELYCQKSI